MSRIHYHSLCVSGLDLTEPHGLGVYDCAASHLDPKPWGDDVKYRLSLLQGLSSASEVALGSATKLKRPDTRPQN